MTSDWLAYPWFYHPALEEGLLRIDGDEAHHIRDTRRLGVGQTIVLFDGAGSMVRGSVVRLSRHEVVVRVEATHREPQPSRRLTLAVAMPKGRRQDVLIEKLTELSVSAVWPMIATRSVVKSGEARVAKWQRTAIEAAKQSHQPFVPEIAAPQTFASVWDRQATFDHTIVASLETDAQSMIACFSQFGVAGSVLALVGPEGDFTQHEYDAMATHDVVKVRLAPGILRVETAAVALAAVFQACAVR